MNRFGELIEQLTLFANQPGGSVEVLKLVGKQLNSPDDIRTNAQNAWLDPVIPTSRALARNASISPVGAQNDTDLDTRALPRVSPFSSAITR